MSKVLKKTKIIATVGPTSNNEETLLELVKAGVNVFRLNFSHGTHEDHKKVIDIVRGINEKQGTNVALLQDLQGPKIRTGEVENNGVELINGQDLIITNEKCIGNNKRIYTGYHPMPGDVKAGDTILIDDGNLELKVISTDGVKEIQTKVVYGGIIKSKKGINLPDSNVSAPSLTEKDKEDLLFGIEHKLDWIALSFVRCAEDIDDIKAIITKHKSNAKVVAKIEKPEALANIDAIIKVSDAIMVARGDLGVEIPLADVPVAQKMIIRKCNLASKPVIVATQMMESMITNPRPTRAEANDVANAVMDGADTVMLSAETASGKFPLQTINYMVQIIQAVEENVNIYNKDFELDPMSKTFYNESVIVSAVNLAVNVEAKAIIGTSKSGFTAFKLSSLRPEAEIYIFTDNKPLVNTLNLVWGVTAFYYDKFDSTDTSLQEINSILVKAGLLKKGDVVVNTGSMPIDEHRLTNMVKLSVIE
jgi:pyruvate kinase